MLSFFVAYVIINILGGKLEMKVKNGYLYHIKNEFFDLVNDKNLMTNHEKGRTRPTYFTIKIENILWFIPLSTKVEKYKKIIDNKIKRQGYCNTILIRKIFDDNSVILLQNAFPTLEKYIDHVHMRNGIPAKVGTDLKKEIIKKFKNLLKLRNKGYNLFLTDVDKIENLMNKELEKEQVNV